MSIRKFMSTTIKDYLTENKNNKITISDKIWYHGSDKHIDKFLFSFDAKNSNHITSYYRKGIYFIDDFNRAKKYGDIVTKVNIDKNSDFLIDRITPEQLIKIYNQLIKENITLREVDYNFYNNPVYDRYSILTDVLEFYDFFMRVYRDSFKTLTDVSEFLLRSGIDGLFVTNDVGDNILVVFNENIINIQK